MTSIPSGLPVGAAAARAGADARATAVTPAALVLATAQLALLVLLVRIFRLESVSFYQVMQLMLVGFVVHALLPLRYRLPFFVLLSFGALYVVLNRDALWVIGLGLGLLGLCHLPFRWPVRLGAVLVAVALLALLRTQALANGIPPHVWPVLGGLFMFRLAVYLYNLKHNEVPTSPWRSLAYLFMLPNPSFTLFPVVDYKTFARQYYDADEGRMYRIGLKWMLRGMVQLLGYRLVYHFMVLDQSELGSLSEVVIYVVATYGLYLRVSGQFHLIIGALHLFGFRLPETHHQYYLSSSFLDLWRRINIYWKDFMMKLVYYPSFFRFRARGSTFALMAATAIVFVITWLLHSYQWFWLRGSFPLRFTDLVFWLMLGVAVAVLTLRESRAPKVKSLKRRGWSLGTGLKTAGFFLLMCTLWSLWSSATFAEWLSIWRPALNVDLKGVLLLAGIIVGFTLVGGYPWGPADLVRPDQTRLGTLDYARSLAPQAAMACGLMALCLPATREAFGPEYNGVVALVQDTRLNRRDQQLEQRGYYENLDVARFDTRAWESRIQKPLDWVELKETEAFLPRRDFLMADNRPGVFLPKHKGKPLTMNRWGMRDQDYDQVKPASTYRIALLGPSDIMGSGVGDGETFEAVLERRLNLEVAGERYRRFEILNFGIPGIGVIQQLFVLEDRVMAFQPDLIVVSAHAQDARTVVLHLKRVVDSGFPIPYPFVQQVVEASGVTPGMGETEFQQRMRPHRQALFDSTYAHLARAAAATGHQPIVLLLRPPTDDVDPMDITRDAAARAGFDLIDLSRGVYPVLSEPGYRVAPWDYHPNAEAQKLTADRLYEELSRRDARLQLGFTRAPRP